MLGQVSRMAKTWFPVALWAEIAPLFALFASRPKGGRARAEDKLRKSISHATLLAGLSIFESGAMSDEAFAACAGTAPNYVCAGDVTSQQTINGSGLVSVTTTAGFSVNSAGGSALTIYGWDDVSYIDANASSLNSAGGFGLDVHAGPTQIAPVLLTIRTAGDISGASGGIRAENFSIDFAGSVDIKAGDIWSSGGNGLDAASFGSVQIEAGSISAGQTGIYARSYSSGTPAGAIIIKADSVTADQYGIQAIGRGGVRHRHQYHRHDTGNVAQCEDNQRQCTPVRHQHAEPGGRHADRNRWPCSGRRRSDLGERGRCGADRDR
jgi:hypothetical protein